MAPLALDAPAMAGRASRKRVEAGIPVLAAETVPGRSDLPALLPGPGVARCENPSHQRADRRSYPGGEPVPVVDRICRSGSVWHVRHIPMVPTAWGVGVTVLGRCSNTGPALSRGTTAP